MHCKLPFYQLQNFMSNIVDSPLVQARQIMSLSPTSPTQMHGSSQPSNLDQLIMPIHQITQTQKQPILSDSGISNTILIQCFRNIFNLKNIDNKTTDRYFDNQASFFQAHLRLSWHKH